MEQAYFQDLPFSGGVRARPTLPTKTILTCPYFPGPSAFGSPWKAHQNKRVSQSKSFYHFHWRFHMRACHRASTDSLWSHTEQARLTASSCLQVQSSSEDVSKICQLVKHNQDVSCCLCHTALSSGTC